MTQKKAILIAGVGSIGERHLRCFQATGHAEVSFCELNPALRKTISERYGVTHGFDDFSSALETKPDAVVICTPAHLHVTMALKAAEAGAHLLIEKPLSTSMLNISSLQASIAAKGLIAAVAYTTRAHPALDAMRTALRRGRFGRPVQIIGTAGQCFPHYRPAYRDTYYKDRATGGGAVQDALTHIINAGEWLIGPVDRLVADLDHQVLEGVTVEDTVHVLTRHGKVMGCFSLNQHQAPNESTITVVCEKGTVQFEYHHCRWRWADKPGDGWHEESSDPLERDSLFIRQARVFLGAVLGENQPLCSLTEGIQTLQVNLAILASAEKRVWQTISP